MAKIRLLSPAERKAFQLPPVFQASERETYFEISDATKKIIDPLYSSYRKVGFVLQLGYFRKSGRFFNAAQFHAQDIAFVCRSLTIDRAKVSFEKYHDHRFRDDQQKILELTGFQGFDQNPEAHSLLIQEVTRLVEKQIRPKVIIFYLSDFFFQKKIESPDYPLMAETILKSMETFEEALLTTLKSKTTKKQSQLLDALLPKINLKKSLKPESFYARAPLVALREFPLSTRPQKIKSSMAHFLQIKALFENTASVLQVLSLSPSALKYYAVWVQKAKITQLMQITNPYKRYLYLLAFIAHHYYCRQDLLIDTILHIIQKVLHRIEKKQDEAHKETRKEKEKATQVLSSSYRDKKTVLAEIQVIVDREDLSGDEKIEKIKPLLIESGYPDDVVELCLQELDKQINASINESEYYALLEKESSALQKCLSPIIKHLSFNVLSSSAALLEAIEYFKTTQGNIGQKPPTDFLAPKELKHIRDDHKNVRQSLYKALLLVHIANAIRAGQINLTHSYRYLSIDEYLISQKKWKKNKQDYLSRAELTINSTAKKCLTPLQKKLNQQYHAVNKAINSAKNTHVSFNKEDEIIVTTPKVEKIEAIRIAELLKQDHYVSILDVLNIVDNITQFSDCLQHYRVVQQIKRPSPITFYAGLIGKGCNIGLGKLASVSKGVNGNTLETVVNWYFSNDHLMAANQRIIRFINKLALPDMMRRTLGKLHTSSDGKKRNVDIDSILANFSFKYHGSGRGVSIYDFIDERHVLFHSLVMSSSEREAAYVIDGLMCNDEIKSDIHSTDTHGYTDIVFAITHLLGISFAPRLAKIKKRHLYSFEKRKFYQKLNYKVLPDETIKGFPDI